MKKQIMVLSLILSCSFLFTGCATAGKQPIEYAPLIQQTAQEGTILVLGEKPEWQPQFEAASIALDVIAKADAIDPQLVLNVVNTLPVKELKGKKATLALSSARLALAFVT